MIDEQEVKSSRMYHKCQSRKLFTRSSYKLREFVLTGMHLKYYDVSSNVRTKLKGRLHLSSIKFIENVLNDDLDNKSNVFQIGYLMDAAGNGDNNKSASTTGGSSSGSYNLAVLYVVSNCSQEREQWIESLKFYARMQLAVFQPRYHPGVWIRPGKYSCCEDCYRWSMGCELVTNNDSTVESRNNTVKWELESVVALYSFTPIQTGQLQLVKGERYTLIDCSHPDWWYMRDCYGEMGYVPRSHVQRQDDLCNHDWFYGDVSRQQAESQLYEEGREGCFIVRCSSTGDTGLTLSVLTKQSGSLRVHHYRIRQQVDGGAFYLSEKHLWPSVKELIEYHKHNAGGLVVRLRSVPSRNRDCPISLGVGLDEFEVDVNDLRLDKSAIGQGQFGVVKRGEFRNMQVAVKQMVEGAMNEEDFVDEARNMRFLNHPNLVRLFGVVLKTRPIMIITEYMKHGSMRDFLRANCNDYWNKSGILSDACAQVAKGMAYLDQRNFVHRDLAARNCLVKSVDRRSLQVKVADFGMARFLLDNVYESSAGTKFPVRWAAPEVFQAIYTTRADVWSFGILMWEVFTTCMQNPYNGQSNAQVYQFILGGGRLAKPPNCPDRLYVLMLECWQHEPTKRPGFQYISSKITDFLDQNCDN